jgi:hypothetical protein
MTKLIDEKFSHGAKIKSPAKQLKAHRGRKYSGTTTPPYDWKQPLTRNYTQPIKNQYGAGMCGGELYSQAMQIYRTLVLGLPFQELSEISFYSQNCIKSGGMYLDQMGAGASFSGLTDFASVPTPQSCTESQAQSTKWENTSTLKDCLIRAGMDMLSVHRDIDSIAQAIRDYYFVGFLIGGSNNNTWSSEYPQPPKQGQTPGWYHFVCSTPSIPLITTQKEIPFYQSWGTGVGANGVQKFTETYINSGFIYDAFTFVKHIFSKNMGLGSMGDEVKHLQVKLGMPATTFGFGVFGPKTLSAVKAYQTANGVPATGYVGILTRQRLNSI